VITAGRPIRSTEIATAAVIKKNDLVKMVYSQGAMQISTNGQAMSDGGQGSVIAVKNITSNKVIQATVQDASTVLIDSGEMRTSSISVGDVYEN
jgi:flagella basal body P-ring formation protein FlgA